MLFEIILGLAACVLGFILFLRRNYGTLEKLGVPVVPPSVLGLGSDPFMLHKTSFIQMDMDNYRKYGPIWGTYTISETWLNITDPELIKTILVKNFDNFSSHYFEGAEQKFRNLAETGGAEWRDLRRGLSPTFSSGKIKGMLDLIEQPVDIMIQHLEQTTQTNQLVQVKKTFQSMAIDVIAKCAFGVESNSFMNPDNEIFKQGKALFDEFVVADLATSVIMNLFHAHEMFSKFVDILPSAYPKLWNITRQVQQQRQRDGAGPGDFIDRLNELDKKVRNGDYPALTCDQVTGQGIAFIAAGFETTSNTLSTLCYNLAKHQDVLQTLHQEIDDVLEKFDNVINHETINDVPFLEACIKENLRLHSPVTRSDRKCVKDVTCGNMNIKRGTLIRIPVYVIHHNPQYWPEPELFKPERFLKENSQNNIPFTFLPFGGGPRVCIGERFAMTEMKIAMAKLLQKFTLELDDETSKIELLKGDMFMYSYKDFNLKFIKR